MIVRPCDGGVLLVKQRDHAALCGAMAARWGALPFTQVFPLPEVAEAMGRHDDGWIPWDETPRFDPASGLPYTYRHMPPEDYVEIWERGVGCALDVLPPLGALLVSLHGARFFEEKHRPRERGFLAAQRRVQRGLLRELGHDPDAARGGGSPAGAVSAEAALALPEPVRALAALLRYLDGLSLFLCEGWPSPWRARVPLGPGYPDAEVVATRGPYETVLEPYPFLGAPLVLEIPALWVPEERFADAAAMHEALSRASPERLVFRLAPPNP